MNPLTRLRHWLYGDYDERLRPLDEATERMRNEALALQDTVHKLRQLNDPLGPLAHNVQNKRLTHHLK